MSGETAWFLCGWLINPSWEDRSGYDAIFLSDEKWETQHGREKVIFMDAKELEMKYLEKHMPVIWTSFHRLSTYPPVI